jgi:hypothetical protein
MLENCFKLLMQNYSVRKMSIDFLDISDNTPLYMAVESGFRDRAKLLLSEGADSWYLNIAVKCCCQLVCQ